ncbi:MAG: hypothetical protein FJZ57_08500 [Chlamydiae bacterium]|nr:hypothetical protein [Chlamydiota bacterium]
MRINQKILNIPPYISTPWKNISSLKSQERNGQHSLIITLTDGSTTEVPGLDKMVIDAIFAEHAKFYDYENKDITRSKIEQDTSFPLFAKMSIPGLEGIGSILQHNIQNYNSPNLPADILNKLSSITLKLEQEDIDAIPEPEPHCNCPHCQITRAIHSNAKIESNQPDEIECEFVSDKDLQFRTWDIKQTSDHIYEVRNPIDKEEYYHVHLDNPIGCTCGCRDCDHIKAVLES